MARNARIDRGEREKDGPGYEPDWNHNADHHAQETDIKVTVQSIRIFDHAIIHLEDRNEPPKKARR